MHRQIPSGQNERLLSLVFSVALKPMWRVPCSSLIHRETRDTHGMYVPCGVGLGVAVYSR